MGTKLGKNHSVIFALSGAIANATFSDGNPSFIAVDSTNARVAKRGVVLRNDDLLGFANHVQPISIYFGNEQRRAMTHDVIVVGTAASVNQIQLTT